MQFGNLKIEGFAGLAPMAGVADRAFRELCREYGAAYTVSEMISSKGVTMGDKKSKVRSTKKSVRRACKFSEAILKLWRKA